MINEEIERSNLFTRRAFLIAGGKFTLLSLLLGRLYHMEVIKSDEYKVLSDQNHINLLMVSPVRGNILDRAGRILAENQNSFRVMLDKKETKNYIASLEKLFSLLNLSNEQIFNILQKVEKSSARLPIQIFDNLLWQDVAAIEESVVDMPGIFIEMYQIRFYPYRNITSHVVGHTGILNEEEKQESKLRNVGDFHVGKRSLEKYYNSRLIGEFGIKKMEVNVHGLYIREISSIPSVRGEELKLSLDIELQSFATSRLDSRGSAAVVTDIRTGEVLVMASTPGFEPNNFVEGVSQKYWDSLLQDEYKPLINKVINGNYPPGSTFKLVLLLAALEENIPPNFMVDCCGYTVVGNRKFRCASKHGHGRLDMRSAIQRSCNCYMYQVAKIIGVDKIIAMAKKLGFGSATGVDLPDESSGFIPTRRWKKEKLGQEWALGDTMNTAIGQGYVLATPIQISNFAATIASGGILCEPRLVKGVERKEVNLHIPQKHLEIIRDGMFMASNVPGGTAYRSKSYLEGFEIAGKTGTSQVIAKKADNQNLSSGFVPWNRRNHGIFMGFAPFNNPKYSCAVLVEHGGDGSSLAAPIARDILLEANRICT